MSLSRQPAAYRDCDELYRLAVATPGGARVPVGTRSVANTFQLRMNNYRVILREQNSRAYPKDHHLHNTSEFDYLAVTIAEDTEGEWWVYVKPHGHWSAVRNAEPIPDDEIDLPPHDLTPKPRSLVTTDPANEPTDLE